MITSGAYLVIFIVTFHSVPNFAQDPNLPVRLVGGLSASEGRAEIQYQGAWGTICDDDWSVEDAGVFCRMLGYVGNAREMPNSYFGNGTGPIWLDQVNCAGSEKSLADCQHNGWGKTDCNHGEDAGVQCFGVKVTPAPSTTTFKRTIATTLPPKICNNASQSVRLVGGANDAEGRVEVFSSGSWGSICDDGWGLKEAAVICKMLCYNPANARAHLGGEYGNASSPFLLDQVKCSGTEDKIVDCAHDGLGNHDCTEAEAAAVSCIRDTPGLPQVPKPTIECKDESISVTFDTLVEPHKDLKEQHLTLTNEMVDCGYTRKTDVNQGEVSFIIPFTACGTKREKNATHIMYRNSVRYNVPPQNSVITRSTKHDIAVYCALKRDKNDENNYQPESQTVAPRFGDGQFNVAMNLYKDNTFTNPIAAFPAQLKLGQYLYVGVTLSSKDTGLKLVVPNCTATAGSDRDSKPNYPFIADKCKAEGSVTFYPFNETIFAFRFQTFKFFGNYTFVYLHCDAFVCEISEKTSQCDRTCSTRRKRSVSPYTGPRYHFDEGPIELVGPDGEPLPGIEISDGEVYQNSACQRLVDVLIGLLVTLVTVSLLHL